MKSLIGHIILIFLLSFFAQGQTYDISFMSGNIPSEVIDIGPAGSFEWDTCSSDTIKSLKIFSTNPNSGNTSSPSEKGWIVIGPISGSGTIVIYAHTSQSGNSGKLNFEEFSTWDVTSNTGMSLGSSHGGGIGNQNNCDNTQSTLYTFQNASIRYLKISVHANSADYIGIFKIEPTTPLPVELVSFSGHMIENKIRLQWKTATEINNYGFEIQKKVDLGEWRSVGFVPGHGVSNSYKSYSFTDQLNSVPFSEARYRLKQIDRDGSFTYSNELVFSSNNSIVENLVIYPNPSESKSLATISFNLTVPEYVSIDLYDMKGQRIRIVADHEYLPIGLHFKSIDLSGIPTGSYIIRFRYEGSGFSGRIVVQ